VKVVKHDLILLAQISYTSTEADFRNFMIKLLELFSTDRRLLDSRGSLIIRQLCLSLQTERIYKSFAEILEKEEVCFGYYEFGLSTESVIQDLEFAGHMIQTLNLILITSPELSDLRKRLKTVETRVSA
jgi:vacuole morphology and inheritance protein 14